METCTILGGAPFNVLCPSFVGAFEAKISTPCECLVDIVTPSHVNAKIRTVSSKTTLLVA